MEAVAMPVGAERKGKITGIKTDSNALAMGFTELFSTSYYSEQIPYSLNEGRLLLEKMERNCPQAKSQTFLSKIQ